MSAENPLDAIDPELTIFALANGVDLDRDPSSRRALLWFADGMERRIEISITPEGSASIEVHATGRIDGRAHHESSVVESDIDAEQLRTDLRRYLANSLERANALTSG